jgi:hypothetical protein
LGFEVGDQAKKLIVRKEIVWGKKTNRIKAVIE